MLATLTNEEAEKLIDMLKTIVNSGTIYFPNAPGSFKLDLLGEQRGDEFIVNVQRKGINAEKCTYQGRIRVNGVILLRLDVAPTGRHVNKSDGKVILGTHLHIYNEEFGAQEAVEFDTSDKNLYEICYTFFEKFGIIKPYDMVYQTHIE